MVILMIYGEGGNTVAFAVYRTTLILLFLASTLYHSLIFTKASPLFRKFDHIAIILLIAGTYTPFCLIALKGWVAWSMLGTVWALPWQALS
jgi:hemolysin III